MHPEYVQAGEPWIDPRVTAHVAALAGPDGLARARRPARRAALAGARRRLRDVRSGRTDLTPAIDTEGRSADRRSDFDSVYGDWDVDPGDSPGTSCAASGPSDRCIVAAGLAALRAAERDPAVPHRRAGADA